MRRPAAVVSDRSVNIHLRTPDVDQLSEVVGTLRDWQDEAAPVQLHPGDLGWAWTLGATAVAAAVRTWHRGDTLVALAFLDGPDVLRLTVAPDVWRDDDVARRLVTDLADPTRGVLPAGEASVEAPNGTLVQELLTTAGWGLGESWTPLRHDFTPSSEPESLEIEVVTAGHESAFTAVHRSAWGSPRFTDEVWRTMAAGSPYADARCLLGRDDEGVAVAGVTVWSAGRGRPGLIEPMGVHAAHRGLGHGAAICRAAAAELSRLGASSAVVCTPTSLTSAVATYRAAGFRPGPERFDRTRPA